DSFGFLLLVMLVEQLPVGFHLALDNMTVDEKGFILRRLGLLDLPLGVNVLSRLKRSVCVVLANLVELLLVFLNFAHELPNVGQGLFRRRLAQSWRSTIGYEKNETCNETKVPNLHAPTSPNVTALVRLRSSAL